MGALFADEPLLVLEAIGLVAVGMGLILASAARTRSQREGGGVAEVFLRDVSQAGYVWAGATAVVLAGALGDVEGLRVPIWLLLAVATGLACLLIARVRWLRTALGSGRLLIEDANRHRPRLESTSWEIGLLGAGAGGLLAYGGSVAHAWGHPVHWLVGLVGLAMGYAVGVVLVTPRFTVTTARS